MTSDVLIDLLKTNGDAPLLFKIGIWPLPVHFHVTEVGRVHKTFIDCGGTRREALSCQLQVWTADDEDHRLTAGKLAKIMALAQPVLGDEPLPVEVEYGANVAGHYGIDHTEVTADGLLICLAGKKTDCLAPDKCGVGKGCC